MKIQEIILIIIAIICLSIACICVVLERGTAIIWIGLMVCAFSGFVGIHVIEEIKKDVSSRNDSTK